jgi:hypothetical protein
MRTASMKTLAEMKIGERFWHRGKEWEINHRVEQETRLDWNYTDTPEGTFEDVRFEAIMATCLSGPRPILFMLPFDLLVSTENPYSEI